MTKRPSYIRSGLAAAGTLLVLAGQPALADEADAKQILKSMSDYMAAQTTFAFTYDATLEVVTNDDQKLGIATSGTATISRPDKIHATRSGGFTEVEMVYDGQQFSLAGKLAGVYTQLSIDGSIDHLIDELRETYGVVLPAADLLTSDVYDGLMAEVLDIKDLGVGIIGGQVCNHLAFRTAEVDWQIWIAEGDQPYPCRYQVTTRGLRQAPQYRLDVLEWNPGVAVSAGMFAFSAPDGATEISYDDYRQKVRDLPANYETGEAK